MKSVFRTDLVDVKQPNAVAPNVKSAGRTVCRGGLSNHCTSGCISHHWCGLRGIVTSFPILESQLTEFDKLRLCISSLMLPAKPSWEKMSMQIIIVFRRSNFAMRFIHSDSFLHLTPSTIIQDVQGETFWFSHVPRCHL